MTGLAGWVQHHGQHLLTLYPPRGGGRIRIYERLRPLRRASEVVASVLRDDPPFRITRLGPATPLTTSEGEHGAWVELDGARDGVAVRRAIAMIFADEFVVAFDVLGIDPGSWDELDLAARDLVTAYQLGLGVRPRRFLYEPPAGWTPLARGLHAYFYPPGFPGDPALLVVHPATPAPAPEAGAEAISPRLLEDLTDGLTAPHRVAERPLPLAGGVVARHLALTGTAARSRQAIARHAVVLSLAPYLYVARLDRPPPDAGELPPVLEALARSIVPVPAAAARVIHRPTVAFDHWLD